MVNSHKDWKEVFHTFYTTGDKALYPLWLIHFSAWFYWRTPHCYLFIKAVSLQIWHWEKLCSFFFSFLLHPGNVYKARWLGLLAEQPVLSHLRRLCVFLIIWKQGQLTTERCSSLCAALCVCNKSEGVCDSCECSLCQLRKITHSLFSNFISFKGFFFFFLLLLVFGHLNEMFQMFQRLCELTSHRSAGKSSSTTDRAALCCGCVGLSMVHFPWNHSNPSSTKARGIWRSSTLSLVCLIWLKCYFPLFCYPWRGGCDRFFSSCIAVPRKPAGKQVKQVEQPSNQRAFVVIGGRE